MGRPIPIAGGRIVIDREYCSEFRVKFVQNEAHFLLVFLSGPKEDNRFACWTRKHTGLVLEMPPVCVEDLAHPARQEDSPPDIRGDASSRLVSGDKSTGEISRIFLVRHVDGKVGWRYQQCQTIVQYKRQFTGCKAMLRPSGRFLPESLSERDLTIDSSTTTYVR